MAEAQTNGPEVPEEQREVLKKFLDIREELFNLKRDRTAYVKSQDIQPLFERFVSTINEFRGLYNGELPNDGAQTESALDDCAQLMALFFLTIGRNREAPALYATTLTIRRLLDHLVEADMYSGKDLVTMEQHLKDMRVIVADGKGKFHDRLLTLLTERINGCQGQLDKLLSGMSRISPELVPVHEKLISIYRSTAASATRPKFPTAEVENFKNELTKLDETRKDGKFVDSEGKVLPGDEIVSPLLERLKGMATYLLEHHIQIAPNLQPLYDKLSKIRNHLDKISLTQAWSLRETDLFIFQHELDQIDDSRVDKQFVDEKGQGGDGQYVLRYLLRRSYAYIYMLQLASEPVSEALLPVYNQLQTLRKCLVEVQQSGGVASSRELYPYSMKLNSIRSMQEDGVFKVNGEVPEGQENVNALLEECITICKDLGFKASGAA